MTRAKRTKLKAAGFRVTSIRRFLGLSRVEAEQIEIAVRRIELGKRTLFVKVR